MPDPSLQYKRLLIGYAVSVYGDKAPIPLLAGQIKQESGWNPLAKSPYACGLAQFTDDTKKWISEKFKITLAANGCYDVAWALKAQSAYMKWLEEQVNGNTDCDRKHFALRAYNGGLGWIYKDQKKAESFGADKRDWKAVQMFNAGRSDGNFNENTTYPVKILYKHQPLYKDWGFSYTC